MKKLGVYIHIPFCVKKCLYCDFLSFENAGTDVQGDYVLSLIQELKNKGEVYGKDYSVDSVFIGGGTPSLLNEALIGDLMSAVRANFNVLPDAEITMESNPNTLTGEKLKATLEAGINRLSMGVQSMDRECLQLLGRIHTAGDFLDNYRLAREAGFKNINMDLMFAIPGLSMEIWKDTLEQAIRLNPEHISFYSLQIEEGTPFFDLFKQGKLNQAPDLMDRDMYHTGIRLLEAGGYHRYEISNASKDGFACRHNLKYWSFEEYLGIGLGAHSFMEGTRFSNTKNLGYYMENGMVGGTTEDWRHVNTKKDNISEYLFTGLRKKEGISREEFQVKFGVPFEAYYKDQWEDISQFIETGGLVLTEDRLMISEQGIDLSNRILSEFV